MTPPVVLTIAGTDSGGGAGIAADLATFAALGVHGTCVVTAVTAQDTEGVHAIHPIPIGIVAAQLDVVLGDLRPAVVKTGMLGSAAVVRLVAERVVSARVTQGSPSGTRPLLVVDPVLRASTGASLADHQVIAAYRDHLLPVATVATPNEDEHAVLGHPEGPHVLVTRGGAIATTNDHGTGCTHASALASYLAHGQTLPEAERKAAAFVSQQLTLSQTWDLGRGRGPVAHIVPNRPATNGAPA